MTLFQWSKSLVAAACCLGFLGILVGAAGTHTGGGDLARQASYFLLVHAAASIGLTAWCGQIGSGRKACLGAATMMEVGVALFSGDLAIVSLTGSHWAAPVAPFGGILLMAGWLLAAVVAVRARSSP